MSTTDCQHEWIEPSEHIATPEIEATGKPFVCRHCGDIKRMESFLMDEEREADEARKQQRIEEGQQLENESLSDK